MNSRAYLLGAAAVAALAAAFPAQAQNFERDRNVSVRERPQPAYDPVGVPFGPFRAYAQVPLGVTFTDNVFATDVNQESDVIFAVSPSLQLLSQFNEHELNFLVDVDHQSYSDFDNETRTDFTLGVNGRLDIRRDLSAGGFASTAWLEEPRTDTNTPDNAAEPVEYRRNEVSLNVARELSRILLSAGAGIANYDYSDAVDGVGAPVEQDDRDREEISYRVRADYAYSPALAFFGAVSLNDRNYDILSTGPGGVVSRDSHGVSYFVGADFDLTRLARGEIAVGIFEQDFADPGSSNEDGLATSASVEWFPTELATVEFSASRQVTASGVAGSSGSVATEYGARADYELLRNVIVTAQASRREDDFTGALDRTDDGTAFGVDATYLISRHLGATFGVSRLERSSSGTDAGMEFDENRLGLRLLLRY